MLAKIVGYRLEISTNILARDILRILLRYQQDIVYWISIIYGFLLFLQVITTVPRVALWPSGAQGMP